MDFFFGLRLSVIDSNPQHRKAFFSSAAPVQAPSLVSNSVLRRPSTSSAYPIVGSPLTTAPMLYFSRLSTRATLPESGRCLWSGPVRVPAARRSRAESRASGPLCRGRRRATCRRPACIHSTPPAGSVPRTLSGTPIAETVLDSHWVRCRSALRRPAALYLDSRSRSAKPLFAMEYRFPLADAAPHPRAPSRQSPRA